MAFHGMHILTFNVPILSQLLGGHHVFLMRYWQKYNTKRLDKMKEAHWTKYRVMNEK